jgi:hypothetical protein
LTDITEPTVVVAIAAAFPRLGALVLEKLTELNVMGVSTEPPPQAVNDRPANADDKGNKGAPANACNKERREKLGVFDIGGQRIDRQSKS